MKPDGNSMLQANSPEGWSGSGGVELATAVRRIRELVQKKLHGVENGDSSTEGTPREGARVNARLSAAPSVMRPVASQEPDHSWVSTVRADLDKQTPRVIMNHPSITADMVIDIAVFCVAALLSPGASAEAGRSRAAGSVRLTIRQRAVLRLVAEGLSNKQIAASLGITVPTVKTHLFWAMEKLGAENRTHAAILASQRRLL